MGLFDDALALLERKRVERRKGGLFDALEQYVRDALPGGALNPELAQQGSPRTGLNILPNILAKIDSNKRLIGRNLSDLVNNPMAVIDQWGSQADNFNRNVVPVIQDGILHNRPMTEEEIRQKHTDMALALMPAGVGTIAYHGSPYKFDKFDKSKIGTGEGAQAYGHGLYLAESPEVAKTYQSAGGYLSGDADRLAADTVGIYGGDVAKSLKHLTHILPDKGEATFAGQSHDLIQSAIDSLKSGAYKTKSTNLYKTDIPDEAVARFLDWDKPLSQQAPEVQAVLKDVIEKYRNSPIGDPQGLNVVRNVGEEELSRRGIHGIRYLDGGSRSAGQGSSNFVVFDPEMIRILERNGVKTGNQPWKPGEYGLLSGKPLPEPPRAEAMRIAQRNAAKPVSEGGLGLGPNNTPMERAKELAALTEKDAALRAHQVGDLSFTNIPLSDFRGKQIYKSPSFNHQQSSEYRLGEIDGKSVYMRKANHWGNFSTKIKEGDKIHNAFSDIIGNEGDLYGRLGGVKNSWAIDGHVAEKLAKLQEQRRMFDPLSPESSALFEKMYPLMKKSQAGYIPIDKLVGRIPEKIAYLENASDRAMFDAPIITLKNGNIRSRFAAFDPARRHEADLLGQVNPQILPWLMGAGLLGAGALEYADPFKEPFSGDFPEMR